MEKIEIAAVAVAVHFTIILLIIIILVFNQFSNSNLQPIGTHSAVVDSPNVTMTIVDMDGANVRAAKVGDQLVLRFEIVDQSSKFIECSFFLNNRFSNQSKIDNDDVGNDRM